MLQKILILTWSHGSLSLVLPVSTRSESFVRVVEKINRSRVLPYLISKLADGLTLQIGTE